MEISRQGNLVIAKKGYEVTIDDLGEGAIVVTSYKPFDLSVFSAEDIENSKSLRISFKEGWLLDYKEGTEVAEPPKEMKREIRDLPSAEKAGAYTRVNIKIKTERDAAYIAPKYSYEAEIGDDVLEKIKKGKIESKKQNVEEQERLLKEMKEDIEVEKEISKGVKEIPSPKTIRVDGKKTSKDYQLPKTGV